MESEVESEVRGGKWEVGSPKFKHAALSLNGQKSEIWSLNFVKSELVPAFLYSLHLPLYKTDTSVKRTLRVGPCLSLFPLFDCV